MQYFIGLVPPDSYKQKVIEFRKKWNHHKMTEVVEPHITLKAQGGLTPDKKWLANVEDVCRGFGAFPISLGSPAFFGSEVLYLSMKSTKIYELHQRLVTEIQPPPALVGKYFELDDFVPHMTLAKTTYGLTAQELKEMAKDAEAELSPFPEFHVDFIRVYQETEPNTYTKWKDIPLKG